MAEEGVGHPRFDHGTDVMDQALDIAQGRSDDSGIGIGVIPDGKIFGKATPFHQILCRLLIGFMCPGFGEIVINGRKNGHQIIRQFPDICRGFLGLTFAVHQETDVVPGMLFFYDLT